ncbi:hypothetical protein AB0G20_15705 [Streptomyces sp. NPDC024017]|uniref:hypothetical protein n=1 Tax=Streptomyces sp. NPDC024017 TaxID=3154326 RepID=UPI0033F50914
MAAVRHRLVGAAGARWGCHRLPDDLRQLLGRSLAYSTTTPQTGSSHRPADHSDDSPEDVEHLRTLLAAEKRTTSILRQEIDGSPGH